MSAGKSETDLIAQLKEWYEGDVEINHEWLVRAQESYRFYTGFQQWDSDILRILRDAGKPALTINRILSTVHMPCGYQRRNRRDIRLYPMRGGTKPIADLGSELIKDTVDRHGGKFELSDAFQDGCVCGKGWLSATQDFIDDPLNGDLVLRRESPFDILEDQTNSRYDLNDGGHVFKCFWWDRQQIELQYPGKASRLEEAMQATDWEPYSGSLADSATDDYGIGDLMAGDRAGQSDDYMRRLRYPVRECWYKEWQKQTLLVDRWTQNVQVLRGANVKRAAYMISQAEMDPAQAGHFQIIERPGPALFRAVMVGDMLLEKEEDPLKGITKFPFFRFIPFFADGYAFGLVDNIKGPQEELNKRRSQALHHANETAGSGWIADRFAEGYEDELRRSGSKPNTILDRSKAPGLEKIVPNPLDMAHYQLAEQAAMDIKEISGINSDLLGTDPSASESGKARMIRQEAGLVANETLFDNFDRTQLDVGLVLWELIRRVGVYSEEEIQAVAQESTLRQFMVLDPMTGQPTLDLSPMQNWSTGRYGVRVDQGASSPTMRMAQAESLLEAAKAGIPIPPRVIIDMMDLPNKQEILDELAMQQQAQQQQAQVAAVAGAAK